MDKKLVSQEDYYQNLVKTISTKADYYEMMSTFILNIDTESKESILATQEFIINWRKYFEEMM